MRQIKIYRILTGCFLIAIATCCTNDKKSIQLDKGNSSPYLNHSDTAKYVGIQTCAQCHRDVYDSFIKTGMGSSIGIASKKKSSADFQHAGFYDKESEYHYQAYWKGENLFFSEYRLLTGDTIHKRDEKIDFIIGSGQHTNSHLQWINGYMTQAPMTFYTQQKKWDLPPGFEQGHNSRFSRPIGLECMSCHNAYPKFVAGSENKFTEVPQGIDCERCHGPGSIHVTNKMNGEIIDTSKLIDYSIVNPGKLPIERQFDLCMRCHLQGNAVLAPGKSWYDFKPGMRLSDYITVFLPRYENAENQFIMASHADRLSMSKCFISSKTKQNINSLRPYKNSLTCVTCHNPHVSVKSTQSDKFNTVCNSCHQKSKKVYCTIDESEMQRNSSNCVSCHMPSSGSIDIPHVTIHDHYIRKPVSKKELHSIKRFIGLYSVNKKFPDSLTKAKAYVNQFEKFERNLAFLDSADRFLPKNHLGNTGILSTKIQILFNREHYKEIASICITLGHELILKKYLFKESLSNEDAWTAYRIGESHMNIGKPEAALQYYARSVNLAPHHTDFKIKLGVCQQLVGKTGEARKIFTSALLENSRSVSALVNLGFLDAFEGNFSEAEKNYSAALNLDPDNVQLLINFGALKIQVGQTEIGIQHLFNVIKRKKHNKRVLEMFFMALKKLNAEGNSSLSRRYLNEFNKLKINS